MPVRLGPFLCVRGGCLLGLRDYAKIRLRSLPPLGIEPFGFVVGDRSRDDDISAGLPGHWGCDLMSGGELDRIATPQNSIAVAAGRHRIAHHTPSLLCGT